MTTSKENLTFLLDVFGGADGSVGFAKIRAFLIYAEKAAKNNDERAKHILSILNETCLILQHIVNRP